MIKYADVVLTIAVLVILITAPLGAIAIRYLYNGLVLFIIYLGFIFGYLDLFIYYYLGVNNYYRTIFR